MARIQRLEEAMPDASTADAQAKTSSVRRQLQVAAFFVWWIGSLFVSAGRLDWLRGWISVALSVVGMGGIGLFVRHYNSGLIEARAKWSRKDTKPFDRIFLATYVPLVSIQPALAGLDVVRFHESSMPFWCVYAGSGIFALAMVLIGWVMSVNPFAEQSVRIQTDRGQRVVASGPYRMVRHPMYLGAILMYLALPLVWGSVWTLWLGTFVGGMMIWRTSREDQILRRELAGYEAFTQRTRYRLLPGVW